MDPSPDRARPEPLAYATPQSRPRYGLKHVVAVSFAMVACGLGALFVLAAAFQFDRAIRETTTSDSRYFLGNGLGFVACAAVLIGPGIWYGLRGLRGNAPAVDDR